MTEEPSLIAAQPEAEHPQDSVRAAFSKLFIDGRAYADAEIERQKLRVGIAGAAVRDAAIFATLGLMLAFAGLIAFLVGMVLLLSPYLGPGWSALIILGASLTVAIASLLLAKTRISRMRKAIKS